MDRLNRTGGEFLIDQKVTSQEGEEILLQVKDEILEVLNRLRETYNRLQMGTEVPVQGVNALLAQGEALAKKIGSLPGMLKAGEEFLFHVHKIGKAIKDLQSFDALKKENLITGVKF
ncbi:MAG: hypothetical protein AB1585_21060 [Thermodesulfobacteriota bacterium]